MLRGNRKNALLWLAILAYLGLVVAFGWNPSSFGEGLGLIGIAAALIHAGLTYGWRHALAFFLICNGIAFSMENLSIATGFPFGHYHFEFARDLPHIGAVPVLIGPFWFVMGYWSWIVASILLDDAGLDLSEWRNAIALPVAAAFVMTQWDVVMDAPNSTIARSWIWHDGGADFGVPASNFFGWLLTSWLFCQAFALYLRDEPRATIRAQGRSRAFRLIAILFYLSAGLTNITPWLLGQTGNAMDGIGHVWQIHDIRETAVVLVTVTMGFTALLALFRLYRMPDRRR